MNDIARILRRECPADQHILESCRIVQNSQDNLWPLDGTEDPEASHARWSRWNENTYAKPQLPMAKRRKTGVEEADIKLHAGPEGINTINIASPISTVATMQNSLSFMHRTGSGFVSAAAQFQQEQRERQLLRGTSKRKGETLIDTGAGNISLASLGNHIKAKNQIQSQSTLTSFLNKRTSHHALQVGSVEPATVADSKYAVRGGNRLKSQKALDQVEESIASRAPVAKTLTKTHCELSRKPLTAIPDSLGNHKLRPINNTSGLRLAAVEKHHPPRPYVFLSSSPPSLEDVPDKVDKTSEDQESSITVSDVAQFDRPRQSSDNHVRPAATFHTTSVAQVRAAHHIHKKTLGVRRSMTGWANRLNKDFSVPSKAKGKAENILVEP